MTNNKPTDEKLKIMLSETQAQITKRHAHCSRGGSVEVDAYLFENMIMELQERRKAEGGEEIYQCEFCHHDSSGELQWHWEDVNKDFYDQYDSERRGRRRIIFTSPPAPVVPELCAAIEALLDMQARMVKQINVGASFFDGETISAMNYAPIQARQALELAKLHK